MAEPVIPNLLKTDLKILFVGINPGTRSAELKHHFASPSNRFWRFLNDSGLTPTKFNPLEDYKLLELGFGITNIVSRTTATAAELSSAELKEGARVLRNTILQYRPQITAFLGKVIYQYFSGNKKINWGRQERSVVKGVQDFVLPNPSGLNRIPFPEQLQFFRELKSHLNL